MRTCDMLTEAYADRVTQIAQQVLDHSKHMPMRPTHVVPLIDQFASAAQIPDWRLGGSARKDFVKDVVVALKGKITWAGDPKGKAAARKALNTLAEWLAHDWESELGNVFPDGDPHDALDAVIRRAIRSDHHHTESWANRYLGNPELSLTWLQHTLQDDQHYQNLHDFMWSTVVPQVQKAFATANQGQHAQEYLAHMWDSWRPDARAHAQMQGKHALDQFDQTHDRNPYR